MSKPIGHDWSVKDVDDLMRLERPHKERQKVMSMYKNGKTAVSIADHYGVSVQTIYTVLRSFGAKYYDAQYQRKLLRLKEN